MPKIIAQRLCVKINTQVHLQNEPTLTRFVRQFLSLLPLVFTKPMADVLQINTSWKYYHIPVTSERYSGVSGDGAWEEQTLRDKSILEPKQ